MKVIEREYRYFEGKPVMVLKSAGHDNKKRFIIKMDDLWKYSDTHNPLFQDFMANKVMQICGLLEIQVSKESRQFAQMMASIATVIMDGIDDLVAMPPYTAGHDDPASVIDKPLGFDIPEMRVGMMQ